jgi:hypothetical protein
MDSPLQIETSMSGTKAKVICSLVVVLIGSPRLPTQAAAGRRSRSAEKLTEKLDRISEWKMRTPHLIPAT